MASLTEDPNLRHSRDGARRDFGLLSRAYRMNRRRDPLRALQIAQHADSLGIAVGRPESDERLAGVGVSRYNMGRNVARGRIGQLTDDFRNQYQAADGNPEAQSRIVSEAAGAGVPLSGYGHSLLRRFNSSRPSVPVVGGPSDGTFGPQRENRDPDPHFARIDTRDPDPGFVQESRGDIDPGFTRNGAVPPDMVRRTTAEGRLPQGGLSGAVTTPAPVGAPPATPLPSAQVPGMPATTPQPGMIPGQVGTQSPSLVRTARPALSPAPVNRIIGSHLSSDNADMFMDRQRLKETGSAFPAGVDSATGKPAQPLLPGPYNPLLDRNSREFQRLSEAYSGLESRRPIGLPTLEDASLDISRRETQAAEARAAGSSKELDDFYSARGTTREASLDPANVNRYYDARMGEVAQRKQRLEAMRGQDESRILEGEAEIARNVWRTPPWMPRRVEPDYVKRLRRKSY